MKSYTYEKLHVWKVTRIEYWAPIGALLYAYRFFHGTFDTRMFSNVKLFIRGTFAAFCPLRPTIETCVWRWECDGVGWHLSPWQDTLFIVNGNLNAHRYLEEVVRPHVLPFVRGQRRNMTFQPDNARPHVARLIMNFLRHENVLVMAWPSMSPDLSPIEYVWDEMDGRLRQRPNQPVTLQGLGGALQEVWQEIPQAFHANLVASMRRRCQECVNARGGHTHYWQCELLFYPHCVVTS